MTTARTLIADDQPDVLEALRLLLKNEGFQTEAAQSPAAVIDKLQSNSFDLILMDLNYTRDTTSGNEGLDLLARIQAIDHTLPVVAMTAWASVDLAVEAMRRGAADFIQKPWDNARLLATIEKQADRSKERKKSKSEMDIARHVQQRLLPQHAQTMQTIAYGGRCLPAREVGGDYYDFLNLGQSRVGLVIGDTSGKGIGAALLMANLQANLRSQSAIAMDQPKKFLQSVNQLFCANTTDSAYATLFFGEYDDHSRRLRYANCGHYSPLLLRHDDTLKQLDSTGTVLGLFCEWDCAVEECTLSPGDILALYTDGITEAFNESGEEFGELRLAELLRKHREQTAQAMLKAILDEVQRFSAHKQYDDITLIVAKCRQQ